MANSCGLGLLLCLLAASTGTKAERIVVETTGLAEPEALVFNVQEALPQCRLDGVVSVIDADMLIRFPELGHTTRLQIEGADILLLNKIDLIRKPALLPLIDQVRAWTTFSDIVPISAATGDGVDALEKVLLEKMPDGAPLFPEDFLTDQPERVLVAEAVREKVLRHTRDELPFSTAVVIDRFEEPDR